MPSSVLGKRTRSSPDSGTTEPPNSCCHRPANAPYPGSKAQLPRAKRAHIFNDENESPFYIKRSPEDAQDGDCMQLDPLSDLTPIKRGLGNKQAFTSPLKPKGLFDIITNSNGELAVLCMTDRADWRR